MKYTFTAVSLIGAILAGTGNSAPTAHFSAASGPPNFSVLADRPESAIHRQSFTARGGQFYIGGPGPTSSCPQHVGSACPPGNQTILTGGDKVLSLAVLVPGGQKVYVAPNGALSYTAVHSGKIPTGSIVDEFSHSAAVDDQQFGHLNFKTGFIACPAVGDGQGYQVFGQKATGPNYGPDCLRFGALTVEDPARGAWQY